MEFGPLNLKQTRNLKVKLGMMMNEWNSIFYIITSKSVVSNETPVFCKRKWPSLLPDSNIVEPQCI